MLLALRSQWESASNPVVITPATASLTLAAFAPTVSTPRFVTPAKTSLAVTGLAPAIATPRLATPATSTLSLTGNVPTVATPELVAPAKAALTVTSFAPAVTTTTNWLLTPPAAALSLTGQAPKVTAANPPLRVGGAVLPVHVSPVAPYYRPPSRPSIYQEQVQLAQPVPAAVNNRTAITALYVAGALSDEEFLALLAA